MISEGYFKWFSKAFKDLILELNKIDFEKDPEKIARALLRRKRRLKIFRVSYRFEKFLHDFIGKVGKSGILFKKIDPKKLTPELLLNVSDVIGIIDDISDFMFLLQYSLVLSDLYFLTKAFRENNLKIPGEVKSDFEKMMEEFRIEDKIKRTKDKVIFFETMEDDEFLRYFGFEKSKVKDTYLKLSDFVLNLHAKILEMLG